FDGDETRRERAHRGAPSEIRTLPPVESAGSLSVDALVAIAVRETPGLVPRSVKLGNRGRPDATVDVWGRISPAPDTFHWISLRAADGVVLGRPPIDASAGTTAERWISGLHYAFVGGRAVRGIFFVLGIATCVTLLSGNWIWLSRRRDSRGHRLLARLTAGI